MNQKLRSSLIQYAEDYISGEDPSHDFQHALRVLNHAERLARYEKADLDIIIPASLFHDLIAYPKNDPRNKYSVSESAKKAEIILGECIDFPRNKINDVKNVILSVSFTKAEIPQTLEAKIVQDADMLEAVGAIAVMRTFATSGSLGRCFYHPNDPFAEKRSLDDMSYSVDLFFTRLFTIQDRLNTEPARRMATRRTKFLRSFLKELAFELSGG